MTRARAERRARGERGFTLVELMLSIVISGIILAPITAGVIVGLRTTAETSNRLSGSNDAQLLAAWLTPDIQSTGNQAGDVVAAPTANTECSGVSNRLRLKWRETNGTTTTYVAAYAVVAGVDGRWYLKRYYCVNGGAATVHIVNRNLASSTAATATTSSQKVTMTVTEATTPTDPTPYTITVSGNRRTP
jgi:prepilin-type N-terminal cleavage/methylation domain-containing protein